jgi:hypothetical protein
MNVVHVSQVGGMPADTVGVYIGRANQKYNFTLEAHPLCNPHPIGRCSICGVTHDRRGAIAAFKAMFWRRLNQEELFRVEVMKVVHTCDWVACWCAPNPCHGDVIADFAAWLDTEDGAKWLLDFDKEM